MMRAPTTSVFGGTYSVMYPPSPRTAPFGTGVKRKMNVRMSPGATRTSPVPPPTDVPRSGSMTATVSREIRFAVSTWPTLSARTTQARPAIASTVKPLSTALRNRVNRTRLC